MSAGRSLASAIRRAVLGADAAPALVRRKGKVTSVAPLEVYLPGMAAPDLGLPANRLASYSPVVGDRVSILQSDGDLLVLGKLISGG